MKLNKLFKSKEIKKLPYKKEFIADMDMNGIRFDEKPTIEDNHCHYSGLPSPLAYENI
jgi:hypothetical protein